MIPPHLLAERGVPLTRVVQRPGEFIVVMPKAYSSSISTGYTQSESVYFATRSWLEDVDAVFQVSYFVFWLIEKKKEPSL